jgi:hypothetical protein
MSNLLPMSALDEYIARGWGEIKREKIPDNWRDITPAQWRAQRQPGPQTKSERQAVMRRRNLENPPCNFKWLCPCGRRNNDRIRCYKCNKHFIAKSSSHPPTKTDRQTKMLQTYLENPPYLDLRRFDRP